MCSYRYFSAVAPRSMEGVLQGRARSAVEDRPRHQHYLNPETTQTNYGVVSAELVAPLVRSRTSSQGAVRLTAPYKWSNDVSHTPESHAAYQVWAKIRSIASITPHVRAFTALHRFRPLPSQYDCQLDS